MLGRPSSDKELANLERRRRRMSSQAQLGGLSPSTALSSHATSKTETPATRKVEGQGRKEQGDAESINTTRKGSRASRAIDMRKAVLTSVAENILSNVSSSSDMAQMTTRGRIEKY
ncbi:MAG: hypothetical protein Q9195_001878 [Heterodermia aff. obscurata]